MLLWREGDGVVDWAVVRAARVSMVRVVVNFMVGGWQIAFWVLAMVVVRVRSVYACLQASVLHRIGGDAGEM